MWVSLLHFRWTMARREVIGQNYCLVHFTDYLMTPEVENNEVASHQTPIQLLLMPFQ